MRRKLFTGVLAGMLAISGMIMTPSSETVEAKSINEIRAEKAKNKKKKQQKQSELSKVKSERSEVQKELNEFNSQIENTTEKIVKNQDKIIKNENKIEKLEGEIKEAEVRIAERDEVLKDRVRSIHVNGGAVNYLEVMLGSQSFGDFLDRVLALNVIAEQDRTIIEEQKEDKDLLEENKTEVSELVTKIEAEQEKLEELKTDLTAQLDEKEGMLSEIKEEEEELHAEYDELDNLDKLYAEEEAAFKRLQQAQKKQSASKGTGTSKPVNRVASSSGFIFPSSGQITPGNKFRTSARPTHNGVDIASQTKPPVYAVADGTVTRVVKNCPSFKTPRRDRCGGGYGNHVVITHNIKGQQVSTLYAHFGQGTVRVNQGQSVRQGTHIGNQGNSGSTGGTTGIHLHFEVHPGGYKGPASAVNPCGWIGC